MRPSPAWAARPCTFGRHWLLSCSCELCQAVHCWLLLAILNVAVAHAHAYHIPAMRPLRACHWHPPVNLGDTGCLRVRVSSVEHCIVQRVAAVELPLWRQLVHAVMAANASPCGLPTNG